MKRLPLIYFVALAAAAMPAAAEIYKHVDKDGNVSFSDQPYRGGEWVPLDRTNTVSPPQRWQQQQRQRPDTRGTTWSIRILQPAPDSIIANGLAPTEIITRIDPAPGAQQRVRLLLDGVPVAESSNSSFTLDRIARGAHTLQAELRDGDTTVSSSDTVPIFVYWPGKRGG